MRRSVWNLYIHRRVVWGVLVLFLPSLVNVEDEPAPKRARCTRVLREVVPDSRTL